ncbi:hypothetical protein BJX76DRAFT_339156 [Aspergillus varians]
MGCTSAIGGYGRFWLQKDLAIYPLEELWQLLSSAFLLGIDERVAAISHELIRRRPGTLEAWTNIGQTALLPDEIIGMRPRCAWCIGRHSPNTENTS